MALGQRELEITRVGERRDLAAVLKFDRGSEPAGPGHVNSKPSAGEQVESERFVAHS